MMSDNVEPGIGSGPSIPISMSDRSSPLSVTRDPKKNTLYFERSRCFPINRKEPDE